MLGQWELDMSETITIDDATAAKLDSLATQAASTRLGVLKDAVASYEGYESWCRAKLEASRNDVRNGEVLSDEEVKRHSSELLERLRPHQTRK